MQSITDKIFTALVNWIQGNITPWGVKLRKKRRQHNIGPPTTELGNKMKSLGIDVERIWWGPMTLFPYKAAVLIDAIEAEPPSAVLEVGSGSSTPLLAALSAKYGFLVVSLENHQGSFNYVRSLLDMVPGGKEVKLVNTGFVRHRYPDGRPYRWYDIDLGGFGVKFDFVVIDGPMGSLVGRNGALPEIIPHLAERHRIYLDDAQREHERACVAEWQKFFPSLVVKNIDGCPGMAHMHLAQTSKNV